MGSETAAEAPDVSSRPALRWRRWWLLPLVAAAVVAVLFTLSRNVAGRTTHGDGGGPLSGGEHRTITGFPVEVGVPFTVGVLIDNKADQPAVLEAVRLDPRPRSLEIAEVLVVDPERPWGLFGGHLTFPPQEVEDRLLPFRGAKVPPDARYTTQILLGLRLTSPDDSWYRHVVIDYRVGNRDYTLRTERSFFTCPDRGAPCAEPSELNS